MEDVGYEIIVIYDGEEDRMRLLQPEEDKKYIIVVSNPSRISKLRLPDAPCLFATVDFERQRNSECSFFYRGGSKKNGKTNSVITTLDKIDTGTKE